MYFNFILRSILFLLVSNLIRDIKFDQGERTTTFFILYVIFHFSSARCSFIQRARVAVTERVNFDDLYALPLRFSTLSARPIGLVKYRTFPVVKLLCHYKELHTCNFMGTKAIWRKLFSEVKIVVVGSSLRTVIYLLY